jgi:4-amino-4-deoxy-L-arabinose transferase-like glycosyltransferase
VGSVPLAVAVVAGGLYLIGLGAAPFLDPPEGFHAAIAQVMAGGGDLVTPHVNGVRYFDKPPVPYWLMAAGFAVDGPTPFAARLWSALAAVGCATVTARLGVLLGGPRLGLLAGLVTAANLGFFVYGRLVKPDLPFILCIVLALAGFAVAYRGGGRAGVAVFYAGLGLAPNTKDVLGALGPLAVVALFFWLTRERPLGPWAPWWGLLLLAGIALPWYVAVEVANPGFLWYTVVDNHLLNATRGRVFPDEDVPLGSAQFLGVTALAFAPWTLAVPWAVARALRRPWRDAGDRLWLLFALWPLAVLAVFTLSPFKLPHYGLPAVPALALLVARVWDESIAAEPGAVPPRTLLAPIAALFAVLAALAAAVWAGLLPVTGAGLGQVDVTTRNLLARGAAVPPALPPQWPAVLGPAVAIFGLGAAVLAAAAWRRMPALGAAVALATMLAFLSVVAAPGMAEVARSRAARPLADALAGQLGPGDLVFHEGPLENSGSVLLRLPRPVVIVDGLQSNLAFGATFPEGREVFWDAPRLQAAWAGPGRRFLLTGIAPERSVVRSLPAGHVRLLGAGGGRWLYANTPPGG